jgi:hypothetical protein
MTFIHFTLGDIVSKITQVGRRLALAGVLTGAIAVPGVAHAQKLELTPYVGNYYALTSMSDDVFGGVDPFTGVNDGSHWKAKQVSAVSVGGRLTFWLSNTSGIEVAGSFQQSQPKLSSPQDTSSLTFKGRLVTATGRFLYRPPRTNLHLIVGGGIVSRGGDAWTGIDRLTRPAGVVGAGVRAVVSPKFALNVSAEATVYSFDIDGSGTTNKSKLQSDVVVSIGIPITLSH